MVYLPEPLMAEGLAAEIKKKEEAGKSKEDIYMELLAAGWKVADLESAYRRAARENTAPTAEHRKANHRIFMLALWAAVFLAGLYLTAQVLNIVSPRLQEAADWLATNSLRRTAVFAAAGLVTLFVYAVGRLEEMNRKSYRLGRALRAAGIFGGLLFIFVLSTESGLIYFQNMAHGQEILTSERLLAGLAAAGLILIGLLAYGFGQGSLRRVEIIGLGALLVILASLLFLPSPRLAGDYGELVFDGRRWEGVFSALSLFSIFALFEYARRRQAEWLVAEGIFLFLAWLTIKYADRFDLGNLAWLGGLGLLFLAGGLILGRRQDLFRWS